MVSNQIQKTNKAPNRFYAGHSVSRGVGIGTVLCLHGNNRQFFKSRIDSSRNDAEIARFHEAVLTAEKQLIDIVEDSHAGEGQTGIFETHRLFLKDRSLLRKIEKTIVGQKINCEWAVSQVIDEYSSKYKRLSDKHLREKHIDLEDVGERLIAALGGQKETDIELGKNSVVAAKEINPSTLIEIAAAEPAALVTENGGWTSHTFILARELGIPAVTGIAELLRRTETGDKIIVDGFRGEIVVDPTDAAVEDYETPEHVASDDQHKSVKAKPFESTLDGESIRICTNLDFAVKPSERQGVQEFGIGLYRSEYLFKRYSGYPSEAEQFIRYSEIMELAGDFSVKIRTFDLTLGEIVGIHPSHEKNPALGMRGIRLSLRDEGQFRAQIRALIRAGAGKKLDLVLPMVSDISELEIAAEIIRQEREKLEKKSIPVANPRLGAMIEVPAAVLMSDEIFKIVDFVSVGTNDLVQYLLAVDRDNDNLAGYFRTLHPAVIRSLKVIFDAASRHQKDAVVCGEMAGSQLYVPLLIGLGARMLSMNIGSVDRIAHIISNISAQEAREIADRVAACATSNEAEELLKNLYSKTWPHITHFAEYASQRLDLT